MREFHTGKNVEVGAVPAVVDVNKWGRCSYPSFEEEMQEGLEKAESYSYDTSFSRTFCVDVEHPSTKKPLISEVAQGEGVTLLSSARGCYQRVYIYI